MNIITLTPPWGSLIAAAAIAPALGKHIETRGWPLPASAIGEELAIHQAKGLADLETEALAALCATSPFREALAAIGITQAAQLPRGAIVAVGVPRGSYQTHRISARDSDDDPLSLRIGYVHRDRFTEVGEPELSFGGYGLRRWAWPLDQIRALRCPVPWRGAQGVRRLPVEGETLVRAQIGGSQ